MISEYLFLWPTYDNSPPPENDDFKLTDYTGSLSETVYMYYNRRTG